MSRTAGMRAEARSAGSAMLIGNASSSSSSSSEQAPQSRLSFRAAPKVRARTRSETFDRVVPAPPVRAAPRVPQPTLRRNDSAQAVLQQFEANKLPLSIQGETAGETRA